MDLKTTVIQAIHARFQERFGDRYELNAAIAKYTSARVGGPAEMLVSVENAEELKDAVELANALHVPYFILGGGSNILIADKGVSGLVILNKAKKVSFRHTGAHVVCTAESGANLSGLARKCIAKGLGGLEWGIGVPGTVGGAVFGNAGAHGGDIKRNLLSALIWDPNRGLVRYTNDNMGFDYRQSELKREASRGTPRRVVLEAELSLKPEAVDVLMARADGFNSRRKETQPAGASMGSMFKNPEHYYAGHLIESAGLKGLRIGGAQISEKHANFFLNDESATSEDIRALIAEAWNVVRDQFSVEMELEVELVGDWEFETD